jgi:hypothetical protein
VARKTLNRKNLVDLGADRLAELLLQAVEGDAARQRRVRMALAEGQSAQDTAADIRKRFASIRRARSFLSSRGQQTLVRELADLIGVIEAQVAPRAPDLAFDLLWSLLHLAPSIHERTDDSAGRIGEVMRAAMEAIERLAPALSRDPVALADTVFDALRDNGHGQVDGAVHALAAALGPTGLDHLKVRAESALAAPLTEADLERYAFISEPQRRAEAAARGRDQTLSMILKDVADLQGDVDAWLARYTSEQLTFHTIAPSAAHRLLAAGRAEEALRIVEGALTRAQGSPSWIDTPDLDDAHFACLEALGREADLRRALWARFERRLCPDALRRYLARLPDFEDVEAEEAAKAHVLRFEAVSPALAFCRAWPDLPLAARLVLDRADEIDGDLYELLTPAADALVADHPLAAVLLWRAMIRFSLETARSTRYRHAARHLASCAAADAAISDYGTHPDHDAFVQDLRASHGRKTGFWTRADDLVRPT